MENAGSKIVEVRKDDSIEIMMFVSAESAQSFVNFAHTYALESGAGNGYGAYWVFHHPPESGVTTGVLVTKLDEERILKMARSIAFARSGGSGVITMPAFTIGSENEEIVFNVWGFDLGNLPEAGDMYRLTNPYLLPEGVQPSREGRVLEVVGEDIRVIGCHEEKSDGTPKDGANSLTIPRQATMKIPDWLTKHRKPSATPAVAI